MVQPVSCLNPSFHVYDNYGEDKVSLNKEVLLKLTSYCESWNITFWLQKFMKPQSRTIIAAE